MCVFWKPEWAPVVQLPELSASCIGSIMRMLLETIRAAALYQREVYDWLNLWKRELVSMSLPRWSSNDVTARCANRFYPKHKYWGVKNNKTHGRAMHKMWTNAIVPFKKANVYLNTSVPVRWECEQRKGFKEIISTKAMGRL